MGEFPLPPAGFPVRPAAAPFEQEQIPAAPACEARSRGRRARASQETAPAPWTVDVASCSSPPWCGPLHELSPWGPSPWSRAGGVRLRKKTGTGRFYATAAACFPTTTGEGTWMIMLFMSDPARGGRPPGVDVLLLNPPSGQEIQQAAYCALPARASPCFCRASGRGETRRQ